MRPPNIVLINQSRRWVLQLIVLAGSYFSVVLGQHTGEIRQYLADLDMSMNCFVDYTQP